MVSIEHAKELQPTWAQSTGTEWHIKDKMLTCSPLVYLSSWCACTSIRSILRHLEKHQEVRGPIQSTRCYRVPTLSSSGMNSLMLILLLPKSSRNWSKLCCKKILRHDWQWSMSWATHGYIRIVLRSTSSNKNTTPSFLIWPTTQLTQSISTGHRRKKLWEVTMVKKTKTTILKCSNTTLGLTCLSMNSIRKQHQGIELWRSMKSQPRSGSLSTDWPRKKVDL